MNYSKKILYGLLVITLLMNLVLPPSMVLASEGLLNALSIAGSNSSPSVTNSTYGQGNNSVTNTTYGPITQNIITSVTMKDEAGRNITEVRPTQGSRVQIDFTWELPAGHTYGAGSTFTFQLPDKFNVDRTLTGNLTGDYGTYVVTPEGQVTLTFNEEIQDGQELKGDFFVWRQFNKDKFSGSSEQPITFVIQGDSTIIPVHFNTNISSVMDKRGTANKGMNPSEISWEVDFNKGQQKIDQAVFSDKLPNGLTIDLNSVKLFKLDVQLNGSLVEKELVAGNTPQLTPDGFELTLGDIHNAYRVKYTTKVTSTSDQTYRNTASVSGSNLAAPMDKSAQVTVRFSKPLDKKAVHYDPYTQSIQWAVQYNYNEQAIEQSKAWIEDSFDKSQQELVRPFEVFEMVIDANGNATQATGTPLTEGTDYTIDDSVGYGFKLVFLKDIHNAYEIKYATKAINRVHADATSVENHVKIVDNPTGVNISQTISQVIFNKYPGAVDYANKTIDWKIYLNLDRKQMQDVIIKDNFANQKLTFIEDSLDIQGLQKGVDYTVAPDATYQEGFKIKFNNPITQQYVFTYKTKFDPTANKSKYVNTAVLDWKENNIAQPSISKTATVVPDSYTQDNGNKTGVYDAITKQITWTIDFNYNLHGITNAVIRDFYTGEQTFVANSLSVHQLNLLGADNKVSVGSLVPEAEYSFDNTVKKDGKDGFELSFNKPINSAYRITYKTSLDGHPVTASYSNEATLRDGAGSTTTLFEKSATVTPKHGGEFVNKLGRQGTGADAEFAFWQVNVNRSQSYIQAGSILTDTLSPNQLLIPHAVKLYHTTVDKNGNLSKAGLVNADQYDVNIVGNTLTITFINELRAAYILEYKSFINADNGENISNKVSFKGQSAGSVDTNTGNQFQVQFSGAGGGATTPGKGNLTITKVDAKTKLPLAGAKFGLYDKSGNTLLQELVTDTNGAATFENYRLKDYKLKELAAPAGYLIASEYENGKLITLRKDMAPILIGNVKDEWDVELTKVDMDTPTKVLPNAVFKLQVQEGLAFKDVDGYTNLKTTQDGKLRLSALKPGSYQLVEVTAPHGYKLDSTPIGFTILTNQSTLKTLIAKNKLIKGAVELTKVDDSKAATPLAGAKFELQDATGKVVQVGTTDQYGKLLVNNLPTGTYKFMETAAPKGYKLSAQPLTFDIVDEKKLELTFTNELLPGHVKLVKIEANRPDVKLAGAQFRLLDENEQPVVDGSGNELPLLTTDKDGQALIPALKPGKYFVQEIKAPSGYLIDQKLTGFDVISEKEVVVTVANTREPLSGSVKLIKIETNRPDVKLAGAQFRLLDEIEQPVVDGSGNELPLLTTDKEGQALIPALKPGKYFVQEVKAPSGYLIDQKLTGFDVISEKEVVVTVANTRQPVTPQPPVDPTTPPDNGGNTPDQPSGDKDKPSDKPDGNTNKPTDKPDGDTDKPNVKPGGDTDKPNVKPDGDTDKPNDNSNNNSGDKPGGDSNNNTGETTNTGTTDEVKDTSVNDKISNRKPDRDNNSGNVLPKTGEDSTLPMQLTGAGLILLGSALLVIRRKWFRA
ncbi:SpaA isopeptide-forming pilin-related protein [Paenibacillus taiwanensis]|uniref:SpaA isopeptide-forming pilin-related protein n=1 Tax=Paenibacillus taiwanensis TaxID=401638 RepID=UPI000686D821|nr:SpaA isopeptide-forming pilin-related protein [Paenibacillus taiwanensis]